MFDKLKKIDFEVVSHLVAIMAILCFIVYRHGVTDKMNGFQRLIDELKITTDAIALERTFVDKKIQDTPLVDINGKEVILIDLFNDNKLNLVFLVSFDGCSSCREIELKNWSQLAEDNPMINIQVVVVGDENSNIVALNAEVRSLSGLTPYFDMHRTILRRLNLGALKTPIILLVDNDGRIVFSYSANQATQDRSEKFISLFEFISRR